MEGLKTKYNFLAPETWRCIRILILTHVTVLQLYVIERGFTINPRLLCTDCVEQHFGNVRQKKAGSTNGCTVRVWDQGDFLASAQNAAYWSLVGNNRLADSYEHFAKTKKY